MLTYGSVCSGIEAATVAWAPLGFTPSWFAQHDPEHNYKNNADFPSEVLAYHYPDVRNLGDLIGLDDMVETGLADAPDILVGGTPCQSFSVAGARQGLADGRGQLTIAYVELLDAIDRERITQGKPECIAVWENVPGVLSSKDNAFGSFLGLLAGSSCELQPPGGRWRHAGVVVGPQRTIAWRILDAQHFGLAQRRQRVFVVASARDGFCPDQVLFESEGVRRDSAPSRTQSQEAPTGTGGGAAQTGHRMTAFGQYETDETASTMKARDYKDATDLVTGCLTPWEGQGTRVQSSLASTITCNPNGGMKLDPVMTHGIPGNWIGRKPENGGNSNTPMDDLSPCLTSTDRHAVSRLIGALDTQCGKMSNQSAGHAVYPINTMTMLGRPSDDALPTPRMGMGIGEASDPSSVRRLTPIECERLQGFPDNYTQIPWRNRPAEDCPDGHRYKALGNSMAVPVMRWIGEREY